MKKIGWRIIPIAFFLGLVAFFWRGLSLDPHHLPSVQIGKLIPDFSLPLLDETGAVFHSKELHL